MSPVIEVLRERILRAVTIDFESPDLCWLWDLALNNRGYGRITIWDPSAECGRRSLSAHRASFFAFKGEIPEGMVIAHSCDNPQCVAPYHLYAMTQGDNIQESIDKGRFSNPYAVMAARQLVSEI